MPFKYTWTAKDQFGQKVIKEVEAQSATEAQNSLLAAGFSDLELKEDEIMTTSYAGFSQTVKVSAKRRVHQMENPKGTTWEILKPRLNDAIPIFVLLILVPSYLFYRGDFLVGVLVAFALVFLVGAHLFASLTLICYRGLSNATDWHRWRKLLLLVFILKVTGRMGAIKVPATQLALYRAKAFVGLANLEKALKELAQCEGRPDCPGWMYKLHLAGLYGMAKEHDKAIELNIAAISENPSATGWYDLANRYARYKRDTVKAREALTEAEKSPAPAHVKPFHARCRGIIAYLEADFPTARTEFETAIRLLEQPKWLPFRDGHLATARAYLRCVFAKQGDKQSAKKTLNLALKYLVATKGNELLADCRELIGST